ncbi:hypothetical protein KUTeg_001543 [Tegillarca granosa]|uniref:Acetyl-coenzyme A transporter 1 n=1 Tax=Tegillarca granosa TaxID=220873 RepID=A0ABQ9FRR7_TEGGR|nr:hypothetical protein KUTeg_001543 [Tegillarca granosa]
MLLQSRNVSYKDQALFSIVFWPFSLKLLWAPFVDSLYIKSFGRRKTWLIPVQYLIGIFMILLAAKADKLIGRENISGEIPIDILSLTVLFFILVFLTATQDIVVDGWALSMLSRRNVGWASVCNMVGQTGGFFLGNVLFLALESADFCNKYLRRSHLDIGIVTLSSFMYFWGVVIIITTTLLCILKGENKNIDVSHEQGLVDTYKHLLQIIKLPAVKKYTFYIFTGSISTYCMRASFMAFHAKVSDPAIGGTYMTFLNTVGNLALKLPGTLSLWTVDSFTYKECSSGSNSNCYTKVEIQVSKCGHTCDDGNCYNFVKYF